MAHRTPHHRHRPSPYPPSQEVQRSSSSGFLDDDPHHSTNHSGSPFPSSPFLPPRREFANDVSNTLSMSHPSVGFPSNSSSSFSQNNTGVDTTQYIPMFSTQLGLDDIRLEQAHQFHKNLYVTQKMAQLAANIDHLTSKLSSIEEYVKAAWALSAGQEEALKMLLGNYFLRPVLTYKKIQDAAMDYVVKHRSKYVLQHFTTEEAIKTTVKLFLRSKANEIKSAFRKALWKRVHCGLDTLASSMIAESPTQRRLSFQS
ncbi:hypothetical protein B0H19DRAFT_1072589 [Mycena capillaripes]|nr:hypothetical protein B0H19DRAFT_1072589 [Mycena capillaripes]